MSDFRLHPDAHIGAVHLAMADLGPVRRFYEGLLGFSTLSHQDDTAVLGVEGQPPLLLLTERHAARPKPPRTTGLYHLAIRVPGRQDLARILLRLLEARYPLQGAADHLVSESIYLADPNGNGLEIYSDRPREEWRRQNGQVLMGTAALDTDSLLAGLKGAGQPWAGMPAGTRIGHVHLQVSDLRQTEEFYHGLLGFDLTLRFGSGALFFAAGGYHHHVGANTWASHAASPPPPDAAGLRYFSIVLPNREEVQRLRARLEESGTAWEEWPQGLFLRDPSQDGILLTTQ
jgi:catechol 2,3-dioxygenase